MAPFAASTSSPSTRPSRSLDFSRSVPTRTANARASAAVRDWSNICVKVLSSMSEPNEELEMRWAISDWGTPSQPP